MDTLQRSSSRIPAAEGLERAGYAIVAIGYVLMTLGMLEIGGVFNVALGFVASLVGCTMMFSAEARGDLGEVEAFRRELEDL